ncbi:MAG: PD-(D/E)XK nuclease family protein [Prevotella sp.]|nr:PD-(D/E)XK nuclease family protein [Prevotella sp.]
MVNNISLINDLRLSTNIHETAHSRILYKLLCAHGKEKHQFLKMFLESVGLNIELDIDKAEIKVESEHIDVLIHDCQKYIIIENKVNHACDQDRQLVSYIESLNGKDVYVLYLVRSNNDKDPSENSLPTARRLGLEKKGKYKKISYQTHILNWLHKCKETDIDNELLKSALIQYCNYIEELFKGMEIMNDKDIENFEKEVLDFSATMDPIVNPLALVEKTDELKQKMKTLNEVVESYENHLCKRYLEYFKNETQIAESCLNGSRQIEFRIQIKGENVQFIYDFFRHYQYVWFGAKYPLKGWNGEEFDSKTSKDDLMKIIEGNLMDGYGLDKGDNYAKCVEDDFKNFYSDKNYFCKYCKDNKTAIDEIKQYKEKIESLGTNNNGC